jgi:hypothetical protein
MSKRCCAAPALEDVKGVDGAGCVGAGALAAVGRVRMLAPSVCHIRQSAVRGKYHAVGLHSEQHTHIMHRIVQLSQAKKCKSPNYLCAGRHQHLAIMHNADLAELQSCQPCASVHRI